MGYLGIDVSKAKLHTRLLLDGKGTCKTKAVENSPAGITALLAWAARQGIASEPLHVVMEAPGVYHETAARTLFEAGVTVSMVNPAQVKDFARGLAVRPKTDSVEGLVLARLGALLKPQAWQPPAPEARKLQALLARRRPSPRTCAANITAGKKPGPQERILTSIKDTLAFLDQELAKRQQDINDPIDRHPGLKNDPALLTSIPAVDPQAGSQLLAILQGHTFHSAEPLAAYLGLEPVERQSGPSVLGRARLSKAGPARVRAVLYRAAVVAIRYNLHIKLLYERLLARGKAKKAALGAAMRKLVHLCFGVIKTRTPYQANYAFFT